MNKEGVGHKELRKRTRKEWKSFCIISQQWELELKKWITCSRAHRHWTSILKCWRKKEENFLLSLFTFNGVLLSQSLFSLFLGFLISVVKSFFVRGWGNLNIVDGVLTLIGLRDEHFALFEYQFMLMSDKNKWVLFVIAWPKAGFSSSIHGLVSYVHGLVNCWFASCISHWSGLA